MKFISKYQINIEPIKNYVNQKYFPALTGLRAVAAFMVFCHHNNPISKDIFGESVFEFFQELHVGVTFFFVLSGFLITHRYFEQPEIDLKKYFVNRFARIFPMYFLVTTLTFAVFVFFYKQNIAENIPVYFLNITLLKGYFQEIIYSGVGQGWTLTVEECFYVLAPLLFLFIKRTKIYLVFLPIFFFAIGYFLVLIANQNGVYGFMKSYEFMIDYTFFGRCAEFLIGVAIALFYNKIPQLKYFNYTFFGLICSFFLIFELSILQTPNGFGTDCWFGKIINNLLLPLLGIAPLIYGLATETTWVSRFLGSRPLQILGKSSYVFYLIHIGIFYVVFDKLFGNLMVSFILLNAVSVLLYRFVERPLNIFLRKLI